MDVDMTTVAPFAPLGTLQMKGVLETGNLAPLKPLHPSQAPFGEDPHTRKCNPLNAQSPVNESQQMLRTQNSQELKTGSILYTRVQNRIS